MENKEPKVSEQKDTIKEEAQTSTNAGKTDATEEKATVEQSADKAKSKSFETRTPDIIHTIGFRYTKNLMAKETANSSKNAAQNRENRERKVAAELKKFQDTKQIIRLQIDGVEVGDANRLWVITHYKNLPVKIPENAFFEKNYKFPKYADYENQSESNKFDLRLRALRNYIGAVIPVLIVAVSEAPIKRKDLIMANTERFAIGDRTAAMALLRDIYFYHKNSNGESRPIEVTKGSTAFAQVLCVAPRMLTVEVCGVETRMDLFSITNEPLETTHGRYKPGDQFDVRITKIYDNGEDGMYLSVTGRVNLVAKEINSIKPGSVYRGKVDSYDKANHRYNIRLINGVNAVVSENMVYRGEKLVDNNLVDVTVVKVCPTFVIGRAKKV